MRDLEYNKKDMEILPANKLNFFNNILGIVLTPYKTYKEIVLKPKILPPFLFMLFASPLPILVNKKLFTNTIRKTLEEFNNSNNLIVTSEELDKRIMSSFITAVISTPITTILTWIVFTTILFGLIKTFNGQGTYKQILSITGHAYIIKYCFIILTLVASLFTWQLGLDLSLGKIASIFMLNLNIFVEGMLKGFSFFRIWEYIVIGIGVFLASKLDKSRVYAIIIIQLVLFLLYSGASQLLSTVFMK